MECPRCFSTKSEVANFVAMNSKVILKKIKCLHCNLVFQTKEVEVNTYNLLQAFDFNGYDSAKLLRKRKKSNGDVYYTLEVITSFWDNEKKDNINYKNISLSSE